MKTIDFPSFLLIVPRAEGLNPDARAALMPHLQELDRIFSGEVSLPSDTPRVLFGRWLRLHCVRERDAMAPAARLHESFIAATRSAISPKQFGSWLTEIGHGRHKRNGNIWRCGLRLCSTVELSLRMDATKRIAGAWQTDETAGTQEGLRDSRDLFEGLTGGDFHPARLETAREAPES